MNIISPLFSMFDRKTRAWTPPVAVVTSDAAIRGFKDAVLRGDRNNDLANHPEDFTLYELGTFNSSTGVVTVYEEPQIIFEGFNIANPPTLPLNG